MNTFSIYCMDNIKQKRDSDQHAAQDGDNTEDHGGLPTEAHVDLPELDTLGGVQDEMSKLLYVVLLLLSPL